MATLLRRLGIAFALVMLAACASNNANNNARPAADPPPRLLPPQPQVTAQDRAKLHTDLGAGYYERGQLDVAIDELNNAVKIDPNYAPAYNIYGLVYAVLGDDRKAEQNFARALELAPNDSDTHHNWGWYLCQHKREKEALVQFDIAVANPLYKTPEIALINAGRCAQAIGEVKNAEVYFRRALVAQPGNVLASYGLATLSYKEAQYDQARVWMRAVMQASNPPPDAIYLGVCVERKLGDRQSELSYISQLRNRYPNAPETKAVLTEVCE